MAQAGQLAEELAEFEHALAAIQQKDIFKTADDLVQRDTTEKALAAATDQALCACRSGHSCPREESHPSYRLSCTAKSAPNWELLSVVTGSLPGPGRSSLLKPGKDGPSAGLLSS